MTNKYKYKYMKHHQMLCREREGKVWNKPDLYILLLSYIIFTTWGQHLVSVKAECCMLRGELKRFSSPSAVSQTALLRGQRSLQGEEEKKNKEKICTDNVHYVLLSWFQTVIPIKLIKNLNKEKQQLLLTL